MFCCNKELLQHDESDKAHQKIDALITVFYGCLTHFLDKKPLLKSSYFIPTDKNVKNMFGSELFTLTVTQRDRGIVTRTKRKETKVRMVAQIPGPSGSAEMKEERRELNP